MHNVAHKVTKALKFKIRRSELSLCYLVKIELNVWPYFRPSTSNFLLRNFTILQLICQHKNNISGFSNFIHIKQPVYTDL